MQNEIIELLRDVVRGFRQQHVRLAAGQQFPFPGYGPSLAAVREICEHPGITVNELARLTGLPKSRVSVLMTRLAAQRIVRKDSDEHDSRLVLWVPKSSSTSRDQAIFVDRATDASLSSYAVLPENDRLW